MKRNLFRKILWFILAAALAAAPLTGVRAETYGDAAPGDASPAETVRDTSEEPAEGPDPRTEDPQSQDTRTEDPQSQDTRTEDPQSQDTWTEDPQPQDTWTEDPQPEDPQPEEVRPETALPDASVMDAVPPVEGYDISDGGSSEPERESGTEDRAVPSAKKKAAAASKAAAATYYYWIRLDLNGGSIAGQTRYPQFYADSDGSTIDCKTLENVDRKKNYLAFIGSGENAGKSYCYWDTPYYNSDRLYLPSVTASTTASLNPGLNASRPGYHIGASKAYNTRADGSGTSFCSRDYNSSTYATLERLTGSASLNLSANKYGKLYVNWIANTVTVTASVKQNAVPVSDAGADFCLSAWSAASGAYTAWSSSPSLTDNGDGTYSLPVTYSEDNQGKFRIRLNGLSGDYSFTDTAVRYIDISACTNGSAVTETKAGNALDWEVSNASYTVTLHANGGTVYGSSSVSVKAAEAESGSSSLRFGRKYTLNNTRDMTASGYTMLSHPFFTRDGYTFGGWSDSPDPQSASVLIPALQMLPGTKLPTTVSRNSFDASTFGLTPSSSASARKITLYARWIPRVHRAADPDPSNERLVCNDDFAASRYGELTYFIPYEMSSGNVSVTAGGDADFTWKGGHFYYNNELTAETDIPGRLTLLLTDRAFDRYGRFYDVLLTFSGIRLSPEYNGQTAVCAAGSEYIFNCANADGRGRCSASSSISASYQIDVTLIGKDGQTLPSGSTLLYFSDLDHPDKTTATPWIFYSSGSIAGYTEAITVPETSSAVFYTRAGENNVFAENVPGGTRLCGAEGTGDEGLDYGTITNPSVGGVLYTYNGLTLPSASEQMTAVSYLSDIHDIRFCWSGSSCSTLLFASPSAEALPVTGSVTVRKRDSVRPEKAVEGAVLKAMRCNGSGWEPFGDPVITDPDGEAVFELLYSPAEDSLNQYYICEQEGGAPAGYKDSEERLYFKTGPDGTVTGYSSDSFDEPSAADTIFDEPDEVTLTLTQTIDREDLTAEHGSPNFACEITGTTLSGTERTFHTVIDFTGVSEGTGSVSRSKALPLPAGTWTIRPLPVLRYALAGITVSSPELTVSSAETGNAVGGTVLLTGSVSGTLTQDAEVFFTHKKTRWEKYSHTSSAVNHFGPGTSG